MKHENPDLPVPPVLGERYEVSRLLREEPWGDVWLAQDRLLGAEVALKVLSREAPEWPAAQGYYKQEASLALKLRSPDLLGVFHLERTEAALLLMQEPFTGESLLAQFARQQRFSLTEALHLLEQVSQALAFAHQRGGVHHAFNPANIFLQGEEIRVGNFAFPGPSLDQALTLELKAYDAPEVIYGDTPTPASNIFSLGVLGFRLVAGSLPYALTFDEPFPYRLEALPADLGEIPLPLQNLLLRCLAVDPEERFPDAAAFLNQLRQVREVKRGGRPSEHQAWEPEKKDGTWRPAAARAGALLGKAWEAGRPLAQKAKGAALRGGGAVMGSPRLLLWGLGLAGLVVLLIWLGVKLNRPVAELSPPFPGTGRPTPSVAAKPPAPLVGGPPLTESEEAPATREQATARPAPATAPAAAPEAAKAREERFILVAGTFTNQKQAQALVQKLKKDNFKARIVSGTAGGKIHYQVHVGPVTGAKAAEELAQRLKAKEKITPKVMKMATKTKPTPKNPEAARRTAR